MLCLHHLNLQRRRGARLALMDRASLRGSPDGRWGHLAGGPALQAWELVPVVRFAERACSSPRGRSKSGEAMSRNGMVSLRGGAGRGGRRRHVHPAGMPGLPLRAQARLTVALSSAGVTAGRGGLCPGGAPGHGQCPWCAWLAHAAGLRGPPQSAAVPPALTSRAAQRAPALSR